MLYNSSINAIVNDHVLNHLNELKKYYDLDRIVAVMPYGSMNYNLFEAGVSDVDTKAIYLPSLHEVLFHQPLSKTVKVDNEEQCDVKDIRTMVQMWRKQNINFLEILFTDYMWVNPLYKDLFQLYFLDAREAIANYDSVYTYHSLIGQSLGHLRKCDGVYDGKMYANAIRMLWYLEKLQAGKPFRERIELSDEERAVFLTIKHSSHQPVGQFSLDNIKTKLLEMQNYAQKHKNTWILEESNAKDRLDYLLEMGIMNLFVKGDKNNVL